MDDFLLSETLLLGIIGDFSMPEMLVIGIIAIVIWGKDLPGVARKLSKLYNKLRRQFTDIKDEISRQIPDEEIDSFKKDLTTDDSDPNSAPVAPIGLMAEATDEQVYLSWDPSDRATSYTVKRSRESEEPHVSIASDLPDPSYADSDITQGDVYYYVVTAVNGAGESENSEEAMVTIPIPGDAEYRGGNGAKSGGKGKKKTGRATRRGRSTKRSSSPSSRKRKGKK